MIKIGDYKIRSDGEFVSVTRNTITHRFPVELFEVVLGGAIFAHRSGQHQAIDEIKKDEMIW